MDDLNNSSNITAGNECTTSVVHLLDRSGSMAGVYSDLKSAVDTTNTGALSLIKANGPFAQNICYFDDGLECTGWVKTHDANSVTLLLDKSRAIQGDANGGTNINGALEAAIVSFDNSPCAIDGDDGRHIIDVVTDAEISVGDAINQRDKAAKKGIQITAVGIPHVNEKSDLLAETLHRQVVTDDGFVLLADAEKGFSDALSRKLEAEVTGRLPLPDVSALVDGNGENDVNALNEIEGFLKGFYANDDYQVGGDGIQIGNGDTTFGEFLSTTAAHAMVEELAQCVQRDCRMGEAAGIMVSHTKPGDIKMNTGVEGDPEAIIDDPASGLPPVSPETLGMLGRATLKR